MKANRKQRKQPVNLWITLVAAAAASGGAAFYFWALEQPRFEMTKRGPNHWAFRIPETMHEAHTSEIVLRRITRGPIREVGDKAGPSRKISAAESEVTKVLDVTFHYDNREPEDDEFEVILSDNRDDEMAGVVIHNEGIPDRPAEPIPAKRLLGTFIPADPEWVKGEFHLMNIFVQDGDDVRVYEIVITKNPGIDEKYKVK